MQKKKETATEHIPDISELKRLETQQTIFKLIIDSSDDAILSKNLDGIILSWNKGAEKMFGYTAAEIIGKHITTIIPAGLQDEEKDIMQKIKGGGNVDHFETERQRKNGSIFNASITISPIIDGDGNIIGASKILRDTTEHIKAQQQLKKSELFNLGIINSLQSHIAVLNSEGAIIMVNEQWKAFALNNEDNSLLHTGIGSNYFDACKRATKKDVSYATEALKGIKQVLAEEMFSYYMEYACHSPSVKRWFALRVVKFNNEEPMVVVSHENITERKNAEDQILLANEELRLLSSHLQNVREQERMQIARDIHDDLGQQLTGLKMDVYDLKKKLGVLEEPIKQKIDEITELIDETVTSVRKIASNLRPSVLDDLGLSSALEWQSKELETRFGIKVNFVADEELNDVDTNIATSLFRIYQEVLTNAVRHSNAHTITAKLAMLHNEIILEVLDDGKGMDIEKEHKGHFGILGIKERAFALGGKCEFISSPGSGTYLRVSIPAHS
jgi:PAS domain S-box-containing protein